MTIVVHINDLASQTMININGSAKVYNGTPKMEHINMLHKRAESVLSDENGQIIKIKRNIK